MKKNVESYFSTYLQFVRSHDLYPDIQTVTGPASSPNITIEGETYLNFCSNNYLGLARNEEIEASMIEGVHMYGVGSGSTRLLSGTLDVQVEFEKALAHFLGFEDSITFSSGFLANVGVIRMLVDPFPYFSIMSTEPTGVIISDELNHASIIDGVRLARAERVVYQHNDMEDLERLLKKYKNERKLIITDGIFSMDGELANLRDITALAKEHDAILFVDDSHGVGVLGTTGAGTGEYLGVNDEIDVLMGSFTKAFGSIGGFVAVNQEMADYLRVTARSYIFSDPIIPSVVRSLVKTVDVITHSSERRSNVLERAQQLRSGLQRSGFTVLGEITPIVPLLIGSEEKAIEFARALKEYQIFAPCIRPPAVMPGKERIRFSVMASHSAEDINKLLTACDVVGKKLALIQ